MNGRKARELKQKAARMYMFRKSLRIKESRFKRFLKWFLRYPGLGLVWDGMRPNKKRFKRFYRECKKQYSSVKA